MKSQGTLRSALSSALEVVYSSAVVSWVQAICEKTRVVRDVPEILPPETKICVSNSSRSRQIVCSCYTPAHGTSLAFYYETAGNSTVQRTEGPRNPRTPATLVSWEVQRCSHGHIAHPGGANSLVGACHGYSHADKISSRMRSQFRWALRGCGCVPVPYNCSPGDPSCTALTRGTDRRSSMGLCWGTFGGYSSRGRPSSGVLHGNEGMKWW